VTVRRALAALKYCAAAVAAFLVVFLVQLKAGSQAVVVLNASERFQTISGWEATAELGGSPSLDEAPEWASAMLDRAVDDLGINRLRLEVRSGAEGDSRSWERLSRGEINGGEWRSLRYPTKNDNDDPFTLNREGFDFSELDWRVKTVVLPTRERLRARGERLYLNLCYVAFIDQSAGAQYDHSEPEEYAEFILAAFLHLKEKFGITPDGLEVILEPDLVSAWNDGAKIARAIDATSRRLSDNGFHPEFIAPSVTNMANAPSYIEAMMSNETARARVAEFSYHRYQGATPERLAELVALSKKYGKRLAMLEYWLGNGTPQVLHEDLKDGMNSAWQGRALSGHFNVERVGNGFALPLVRDAAVNRLYFNAARAGWVRIAARSTSRRFDPVAFAGPDGETSVIIQAKEQGAVILEGLADGRYRVEIEAGGLSLMSEIAVDRSNAPTIVFPRDGFGSIRPIN